MPSATYWIENLHLVPHPRGGWWGESYRSAEKYPAGFMPGYAGERCFGTAVYFLIKQGTPVVPHRILTEEQWHFYRGSGLTLHLFDNHTGLYRSIALGPDLTRGQTFTTVKPAGITFTATVDDPDGFALLGRTLAPGFGRDDWEDGDIPLLLKLFPQQQALIRRMLT